jgi:glycosyltransferase involved in cell wall biosynthesis
MALKEGADVFHYHALGPSLFTFIPRLFGKKVVTTVHGLDWKRDKWGRFTKQCLKLGEVTGAKFSHCTISVSESILDYYEDKYHRKPIFIPNGVSIHKKADDHEILKEYGLKQGEYILFLSRIVPEKGLHYLIEAYLKLKPDKKLVIAGDSSHTDRYVDEVHHMAEGNPNIIFTGFVHGEVLEELYSNAYLYVLPSTVEGLPISLLEAMSFGTCCLTSDIDENKIVLKDHGYTFKSRDVNDLAIVLGQLLSSMEGYDQEDTIKYIQCNFSWDTISVETDRVYQEFCHR